MSFRLQLSKPTCQGTLRVLALLLLTAVIWGWQHHRLRWADWSQPLDYTGDSLEILARFQAAAEGDLVPFGSHVIHRLGAPGGANWNEYPGSDDLANYGLGVVARVVGVFAASNLASLLAYLSAAAAFYWCARLLRVRWEWAAAGALLFAFSFFNLSRGLPHLWLTYTGTVPLALFTCAVIAGGRRTVRRPAWRWLCLGTAAVLGAANPYNLFLYFQLLAWALLAAWLRARWSANVRLGLSCLGVAALVFVAIHARMTLSVVDEGAAPLLVRNYAGTEIYGLKPIELFVPPGEHHCDWLAAIGHRYVRWTDWRGEGFSPYLGIVGAVGLIWLLAGFAVSALRRRAPWPGQALPAIWILFFSAIGGVNGILAFYFGLSVFRASNRNSVFLLSLALLFVAARLSRMTRNWRTVWRVGAAGLIAVVGLWDQLPQRKSAADRQAIADRVAADQQFGGQIEAQLGPQAMVFQLPVLDFPEDLPQLGVNEYDHFRLMLVTRTLRFTYGELKNRARDAWQHDCQRMTPAALVRTLESYGFAALCIDRLGYEDHAAKLLADLAAAGRAETIAGPSGQQVVVRLRPAARLQPPLARGFTFGRGWNRRSRDEAASEPRWSNGSASLSYDNSLSQPLPASIQFVLSSAGDRTVRFLLNGREVGRLHLSAAECEFRLPALQFQPGINRLDLETAEPAIRVSEQRLSLRAIAIHRVRLQLDSRPAVELPDDLSGAAPGDPSVSPGPDAFLRPPQADHSGLLPRLDPPPQVAPVSDREPYIQLLGNSACAVATSASEWIRHQPSARWRSQLLPGHDPFPSGAEPALRLGLHRQRLGLRQT